LANPAHRHIICAMVQRQITSENRARVAVLAFMLVVAVIALVIVQDGSGGTSPAWASGATGEGPRMLADGDPDFLAYADRFIGPEEEYYATGTANVRNYPTARKTYPMWQLQRCSTVTARQVRGFTGETWAKLKGDGGYVWFENLAPTRSAQFRRDC
jgi:hypothetical protein